MAQTTVKVRIAEYVAFGGPATPVVAPDGFTAGPTDPGEYVVAYCGKHRSKRYKTWSSIPWGAKLKDTRTDVMVEVDGKWKSATKLTGVSRADVMSYNQQLYGSRVVPGEWVFNDFGHMTCYFFKDKNQNGRLDPKAGEKISGEFFHTTPADEAATKLNVPVQLDESHGCIHLKPNDIDELIAKKYMRKGNRIVVHKYTEHSIGYSLAPHAVPPFELHFYPALNKLVVVGTRR